MKLIVDIPTQQFDFFSALMKRLEYHFSIAENTEIENENEQSKTEILEGIKEALDEVKLHQKGKKQLMTFQQMMNEL